MPQPHPLSLGSLPAPAAAHPCLDLWPCADDDLGLHALLRERES